MTWPEAVAVVVFLLLLAFMLWLGAGHPGVR